MATGRKPKLTPDTREAICKGIRSGLTYEQAAIFAGVGESTFYEWKQKGEKAKSGIYREFLDALKKANVDARVIHLQRIGKASLGGDEFEETSVTIKTERDTNGNTVEVARETRTTRKKMLPQWQASAWLLERRFPSEFGRHIQPDTPDEKDPMQEWLDGLEEAQDKYGNS